MSEMRIDHKGKTFSVRMGKDTLRVIITTERHTILGSVFISPGNRLKDELNHEEQFLAVSDAQVFDITGATLLYRAHFMSVHKRHILWILPTDELLEDQEPEHTHDQRLEG
ncbi:MAG: hypothetical protein HY259_05815 [Chloroflexi bacterium]|nr:hypothetical protein [Chloroflexota bacterium]